MTSRVLAQIAEAQPWGGPPLETLAAERPAVLCSYCSEPVVHDGDQWWHVRTGLSADWRSRQCRPLCRTCKKPATRAIGSERFVGSGNRFVVDHFACDDHLGITFDQ